MMTSFTGASIKSIRDREFGNTQLAKKGLIDDHLDLSLNSFGHHVAMLPNVLEGVSRNAPIKREYDNV